MTRHARPSHKIPRLLMAAMFLSCSSVTLAQCELHEDAKLAASDAAAYDQFGSVSVSDDIVVVGAPLDDCAGGLYCGAAYVYRFSGGTWAQEAKLLASDAATNDRFGWSVSINGDTAVVGAPYDDCAAGSDCGSM